MMMHPNPSKAHRLRTLLVSALSVVVSRTTLAKMKVQKLLGHVPIGYGHARQICPRGVVGPRWRSFADQASVGRKKASRRSRLYLRRVSDVVKYQTRSARGAT